MMPTPDSILVIGAYAAALAAILAPVIFILKIFFDVRYVKKDVTELMAAVTSLDSKVDDLLIRNASWFSRKRRVQAVAGRGRR